ncbi:hypothetical protein N9137_00715 [Pseudomonadales bacterium]|nr:hypothetical protein [Pseudomonadales bacterium]
MNIINREFRVVVLENNYGSRFSLKAGGNDGDKTSWLGSYEFDMGLTQDDARLLIERLQKIADTGEV